MNICNVIYILIWYLLLKSLFLFLNEKPTFEDCCLFVLEQIHSLKDSHQTYIKPLFQNYIK